MRVRLICGAALLVLAACGQAGEKAEEKAGEKAAKQAPAEGSDELAGLKLRAGQWEATQEFLSASAPGMPPEMVKQMVGRKTSATSCITPEDAENPNANFLSGQKGSDCTHEDFSMASGRIAGTMTCSGRDLPGKMVMKVTGDYSPLAYVMNMDTTIAMAPGVEMVVKARTTGRRIGECPEAPK